MNDMGKGIKLTESEELKVKEDVSTGKEKTYGRRNKDDWKTTPKEVHELIDDLVEQRFSGGIEIHLFKGVPNKRVKFTRTKFLGGYGEPK